MKINGLFITKYKPINAKARTNVDTVTKIIIFFLYEAKFSLK